MSPSTPSWSTEDLPENNHKYVQCVLADNHMAVTTSCALFCGNTGASRFSEYLGQWPVEKPVFQDIIEHVQQVTLTSSKHDYNLVSFIVQRDFSMSHWDY